MPQPVTSTLILYADDSCILYQHKDDVQIEKPLNEDLKTFIKQHSEVTYLGCVLDETMSGEPMALKVINKISGKLKFLYRKNRLLSSEL